MVVKIWKFLASRLFSRSPGNIPGTFKVNLMNVVYFFVNYRLYLNFKPKLTAELQVINYRPKILQQCYSNINVLSENFVLKKRK